MNVSVMIKNVDKTTERIAVRGELNGEAIFYNYLDDEDCVIEKLRPGLKLIIELEND